MRRALSLLFGFVVVLAAPAAFAQGVEPNIKTPPLQNSDTFSIPISIHNTAVPPFAGWAGAIMDVHIVDASEVDIDAFHAIMPTRFDPPGTAPPGPYLPPSGLFMSPFGPRSMNTQSSPGTFTIWHPNAYNSGYPVAPSQNLPLGTFQFHVKGSDPAGNSDVDVAFSFWNIWHIFGGPGQGSTLLRLDPSDRVWVPSSINEPTQLHSTGMGVFPPSFYRFPTQHPTPFDQNAHWLHLTMTATFHLTGVSQSAFYADKIQGGTLGIEHVPEPASAALIGLGLVALGASRKMRRRRLAP